MQSFAAPLRYRSDIFRSSFPGTASSQLDAHRLPASNVLAIDVTPVKRNPGRNLRRCVTYRRKRLNIVPCAKCAASRRELPSFPPDRLPRQATPQETPRMNPGDSVHDASRTRLDEASGPGAATGGGSQTPERSP